MSTPDLLARTEAPHFEHDCPYEKRIKDARRRIGSTGLALTFLGDYLRQIHSGGICPPTHEGIYPTSEWETVIQAT